MSDRDGATARCISCAAGPLVVFLDLGAQPVAGWFPPLEEPLPDTTWPLRPAVCPACWLVQVADRGPEEVDLPGAPAPTSSASMRAHARALVADLIARVPVGADTVVLEVASHAGYLQPFFAEAGVVTTAVESQPARAARVRADGGRVIEASLARLGVGDGEPRPGTVDLLVDHYLLAHLEDPDAALGGIARLLAPGGTAVLEFDHLLPTILGRQFDAFRHGHRSYLSLTWLERAVRRHGLVVTEAVEQPVYGGALRVFLRRSAGPDAAPSTSVARVLAAERAAGLDGLDAYRAFATAVEAARAAARQELAASVAAGRPMLGYGAPARAVTLLNYWAVDGTTLPLTADASPAKQGRAVPGVRIPIVAPGELAARRPSDVLVLAWDLAVEIVRQIESGGGWGARYWVPIPALRRVSEVGLP